MAYVGGDMTRITVISASGDPPVRVRHWCTTRFSIEITGSPAPLLYWSMSEDQLRQLVAAAQAVLETKTDEGAH